MRSVLQWVTTITLVVLGLLYLNSAAGSWWLSWGPPTPDPRAWLVNTYRQAAIALGCFVLAVIVFLVLRPPARRVSLDK